MCVNDASFHRQQSYSLEEKFFYTPVKRVLLLEICSLRWQYPQKILIFTFDSYLIHRKVSLNT